MTETRHTERLGSVAAGHGGPVRSRPPLSSPPRSSPPHDLVVRLAAPADLAALLATVRAAFGYDLEAKLIVRLEREGRVAVSMVADAGGVVVGHALLSCLGLSRGDALACPALALAPVAVTPEHQRRGIGSALVRATIAAADPALPIFVIGAPGFYRRFGFEPAETYGCTSRFDVPPSHLMVLPALCPPAVFAARAIEYPAAFGGL